MKNRSADQPPPSTDTTVITYTAPATLAILGQLGNAKKTLKREQAYARILSLFAHKTFARNQDVRLLLRVPHPTASRYLATLVARGKLRQLGTRGTSVRYQKN